MKTLTTFTLSIFLCFSALAGREPALSRTIAERVRMATHVVTGEVREMHVVSETTGTEVTPAPQDLEDGQRIELEILVTEVLQADKARPVKRGDKLKERFGGRGHTPAVFKEMLKGRNLIFYLTQDVEFSARFGYFFPFYGETNIADLGDKTAAVKAAIARLRQAVE